MSIKEFLRSWGFIKDIKKPANAPPLTIAPWAEQDQKKELFNDVPKPSYVLMDLIIAEMLKLEFKVSSSCETDEKNLFRAETWVIQLRSDFTLSLIKKVYIGYGANGDTHFSIKSENLPCLTPEEGEYLKEGINKAILLQTKKQENDREAARQRQALGFIEKFTQPDMSEEDRELFVQVKISIKKVLKIKDEEIRLSSLFIDDLGADSLDLVELSMVLEQDFEIDDIDDDKAIKIVTVQDAMNFIKKERKG